MANDAPKAIEDRTATAAYVLTLRQIIWIEEEAKRRGKNKSELIRDLLDGAMASADSEARVA